MNVPVLRPIVIRDDPRLKTRPWPGRSISVPPDAQPWYVLSAVISVALIVSAFGPLVWNNFFPNHGAIASRNPAHTVVFTQQQNGHNQIFTMDSDGRNVRQITAEDANTTQASWSADGKHLVFVNDIDGHEQIYRIDATGTRETRVTNDNMRDVMPSWSPSGYEIAYLGIDGTNYSIWIMNSDGTSPRKATDPSKTGSIFAPLVWAPDGHLIAFASGPPGHSNIMLLGPKTGEVKQLTALPGHATEPAWSPDGTSLVFSVATGDGATSRSALYTINVDGTGLKQITDGSASDARPTWSPDGNQIAFVRTTEQKSALFVVNADGTNPQQLSAAPAGRTYDYPSWAPEGRMLLFVGRWSSPTSIGGSATLEAINADGTDLRTLSNTLAPDTWPLIRPAY